MVVPRGERLSIDARNKLTADARNHTTHSRGLCRRSAAGAARRARADAADALKPNIVFILADDLGYGDVKCNYPAGKIPTPNIDRLASEGIRFTDAHAALGALYADALQHLTGRYCWRTRLTSGVLWPWDWPLIPAERLTLPGLLRTNGYRTAAIGKWHLGLNWPFASEQAAAKLSVLANKTKAEPGDIDWSKPITGGPIEPAALITTSA